MKRSNTYALALALMLVLSTGARSAAAPMSASPKPAQGKPVARHNVKTEHPVAHQAPIATRAIEVRHTSVRTRTQSAVKTSTRTTPTRSMSSNARTTVIHRTVTRTVATHRTVRTTVTTWRPVSQPVPVFAGRNRVDARAVAFSPSHVIVAMPNGALRTFVAFREASPDRDRLAFRDRDRTRTFTIVKVSRPIEHRVVVFVRRDEPERLPEMTIAQALAPTQDEAMLVEPDNVLNPFAVTAIEPLPFGQMALFGNDIVPQAFAPAEVTFVGQPIGIVGNLVTFLLPDGTTRALVDNGLLPAIGTQVVVVENGTQVVSFSPAVTNFVGQVVAVQPPFVTFALPNGSLRTLTTTQALPMAGTRAVVFEDGDRVARIRTF